MIDHPYFWSSATHRTCSALSHQGKTVRPKHSRARSQEDAPVRGPYSSFLELDPRSRSRVSGLTEVQPGVAYQSRWQMAARSLEPSSGPKLLLSSGQGKLTATVVHSKKPDAQLQRHHVGERHHPGLTEPEGRQGVPPATAQPDRGGHLPAPPRSAPPRRLGPGSRPGRSPGPEDLRSCPPLPPRGSA